MRIPNSILVLALSIGAMPYQPDNVIPELDQVSAIGSDTPILEPAPDPSRRLKSDLPKQLGEKIQAHFGRNPAQRLHVQLDRPLYRPGEAIWFKSWALQAKNMQAAGGAVSVQLIDPSGAVLETKTVAISQSGAANDFVLAADAPGGRWTLKATYGRTVEEHAFVVSSVATPQIQKELDFLREAYGPGQTVEALVELTHGIRGPMANKDVRAVLTVDGVTVLDEPLQTDDSGAVLVSGKLPAELSRGDGLLTVLVEEGGVSESISRSVPIVLDSVDLAFFPEGGDLREGLLSRVYFEAKNQHGEPADIEGYVVDDRGTKVADFRSVHDGLGRFGFTPRKGRLYQAVVTAPVGIDAPIALPAAASEGCVLRAYDDFASQKQAVRVGVRCTDAQDVYVVGMQREAMIDGAAVHAGPRNEAVVYLEGDMVNQGAIRVTVFDADENPLAERLVYRGAGRDLHVEVEANGDDFGPRDKVELTVTATDADGAPVQADLALAVVDDALINLADDEEGHILSRLYLAPELTELPDDPDWYFDASEPDAREGLDLVMGTKGWRRFAWAPVLAPQPTVGDVHTVDSAWGGPGRPMPARVPQMAPVMADGMLPMDAVAEMEGGEMLAAPMAEAIAAPVEMPVVVANARGVPDEDAEDLVGQQPLGSVAAKVAKRDVAFGAMRQERRGARARDRFIGYAPVRQFPAPDYQAGFQGVRSDFRETVFWTPSVRTDAKGQARVDFYLSDAITTFRVTAEGVGGGLAGHGEQTLTSVLPVSVDARIPGVVSAGDVIDLPLTVTSTRDEALAVDVTADIGGSLLSAKHSTGSVKLASNSGGTVWMPLTVGNGEGTVPLEFIAEGGGMSDTLKRSIEVVQPGFPRGFATSGELAASESFTFQLEPHQVGSLHAAVVLHPGPTASLVDGLEGLIRTPGGCFEQTSSTNWPNVAILNYLEEHEGNDRLRAKSMAALDVGYGRLSGFQVDAGGFETFGSGPGKEVLSAFGLLQFNDMKKLYPVSEAMLEEDIAFLLERRDGKGGYDNSGDSAHGYGSAPKPVSDGFITYALVASGHTEVLKKEIARQAEVARVDNDPYVLALAVRSLLAADHPGARAAVERLAKLQGGDGAFTGAQSSITRSYEANLDVESTALATLALMEAGTKHRARFDKGVDWLIANRRGGTWGATQATAMALSALTKHAELSKSPRSPGDLIVEVNGRNVGTVHYDADQTDSIRVEGLEEHLRVGSNRIRLLLDAEAPLPFAFDASWTSASPLSDPGAELEVATELASTELVMGETTRLTATISNRTDRIVPSPIARIGLPAGLEAPLWQLKQLQERGEIAFYETRPREVTLYWEGIHPDEEHVVNLDLEALVPGTYTGPSSSAYPYYNDDEKAWDDGLQVHIQRP